jgi:hypothetical protein
LNGLSLFKRYHFNKGGYEWHLIQRSTLTGK